MSELYLVAATLPKLDETTRKVSGDLVLTFTPVSHLTIDEYREFVLRVESFFYTRKPIEMADFDLDKLRKK